jgi:hypothetical protein
VKNTFKRIVSDSKKQQLTFNKEDYIGNVDEFFSSTVRGWVGYQGGTEPLWVKITKGSECQVVLADKLRTDVLDTGLLATECCGFEAFFSKNNVDKAEVELLMPIVTLSHSKPNYRGRKLFFLHIPKTAGSSVNQSLQSQLGHLPAYTHIEGLSHRWDKLLDARFLSGHITYPIYEKNFSPYNFVVAAFFREPHKHIESHLNWVRHLSEPEKESFLSEHPVVVQTIAQKLSLLDFASSKTWGQFVKQLKPVQYGLFDNLQVRYLSDAKPAERVNETHLQQALARLKKIQLVGIAEQFDESMSLIHQAMGFDKPVEKNVRSNVNSFSYGADFSILDNQKAIEPLVKFDRILYQQALLQFSQQRVKFSKD